MQKDNVFITRIDKKYQESSYLGDEIPKRKMTGYKIFFYYKNIESTIDIYINKILTEEEIEDKIIEVLQ